MRGNKVRKKRTKEFPNPYSLKNAFAKGSIFTRLSAVIMGFGNIVTQLQPFVYIPYTISFRVLCQYFNSLFFSHSYAIIFNDKLYVCIHVFTNYAYYASSVLRHYIYSMVNGIFYQRLQYEIRAGIFKYGIIYILRNIKAIVMKHKLYA